MKLSQGEIWLAKLSPTVGTEHAGTRPVVVVSGARFARMPIHQVIVVPVSWPACGETASANVRTVTRESAPRR